MSEKLSIRERVENYRQLIINAYNEEQSTGVRYWDYNGKERLTSVEFVKELKKNFPSLSNVKDVTIGGYVNKIALDRFGPVKHVGNGDEETDPLEKLTPVAYEMEVPNGATNFLVKTKDPNTKVIFYLEQGVTD